MSRSSLQSQLDVMLLSLLRAEAGHGYALIQRLAAQSGGAFGLPEGTIYPALQKLEAEGLVGSDWRIVAGRRRRVYAMLPAGLAALETKTGEWRSYRAAVDQVVAAGT